MNYPLNFEIFIDLQMFVGFPGLSGGLINEQNQSLPQCRSVERVGQLGIAAEAEAMAWICWPTGTACSAHAPGVECYSSADVEGLLTAFSMDSWCVFKMTVIIQQ